MSNIYFVNKEHLMQMDLLTNKTTQIYTTKSCKKICSFQIRGDGIVFILLDDSNIIEVIDLKEKRVIPEDPTADPTEFKCISELETDTKRNY